ncbi:MAG: hypothetical protein DMF75_07980 [Acidobacteria bacterium]|nr:MAG: hypothetical protein DMF75_07980 [Acidobacteriota bacterium]
MKKQKALQFAVCINNEGYEASLELGKLYQVIPDEEADANDLIRVVDESGEDYAFAATRFHPLEVPPVVQKALLSVRA